MFESSNSNQKQVAEAVMKSLHGIQNYNNGVQMSAIAIAFNVLCDEFGCNIDDAVTYARNMEHDAWRMNYPEILTVRPYVVKEMLKR